MHERRLYSWTINSDNAVVLDGQTVDVNGLEAGIVRKETPEQGETYFLKAPLLAAEGKSAITMLLTAEPGQGVDNPAIAAILSMRDAIATLVAKGQAYEAADLVQLTIAPFDVDNVLMQADMDLRFYPGAKITDDQRRAWDDAVSRMPSPSALGGDAHLGIYSNTGHLYTGARDGGLSAHDVEALNALFRPSRGTSSPRPDSAEGLGRPDKKM